MEAADTTPPIWARIAVVVPVVIFGAGNFISKQIAATTLGHYSYMLGLVSAASYVVFYWLILVGAIATNSVKDAGTQLRWVWCGWDNCCSLSLRPIMKLFALAAIGDAIGDVLGFLCTPYVAGPVHILLANFTTVFTALLSVCLLQKRYSMLQCASLVVVIGAAALGVISNLAKGSNGSNPFMAAVIAFSCVFNALGFVMKEFVFARYRLWSQEQDPKLSPSLNIFMANTAESTLQLPFTLCLLPLASAMGETHGEPLLDFLGAGFSCFRGSGEETCKHAFLAVSVFVFCNLSWNVSILLSIKWNSALSTFVALKAVGPLTNILFACVDWPIIGRTPVKPIIWVSLIIVILCIATYTYASRQQDERAQRGKATCCWPIGAEEDEDSHGRLLHGFASKE